MIIGFFQDMKNKDKSLLPVMVFFHGGGWMTGSGTKKDYGPDRLMQRDVVLVGVNYRIGKTNHKKDRIGFIIITSYDNTCYIFLYLCIMKTENFVSIACDYCILKIE